MKDEEKVKSLESKAQRIYKNDRGFREADYGDGIIMVYIPAGEFTMGSNKEDSDDKLEHKVYLDGYWMGKYEVTLGQYKTFISDQGYAALPPFSKYSPGDDHPVTCVSWKDANAYCEWLSKKKGLNFKLPTEAQWEKAARGSDDRKYPWGNNEPDETLANFGGNVGKTSPVDSYPDGASPYGLLDMAGNVWEWCSDWYGEDYYKNSPKDNPPGPESGSHRVMRGGGWSYTARLLRCDVRMIFIPSFHYNQLGFRLCQDS